MVLSSQTAIPDLPETELFYNESSYIFFKASPMDVENSVPNGVYKGPHEFYLFLLGTKLLYDGPN